jgi:hypothetical protein
MTGWSIFLVILVIGASTIVVVSVYLNGSSSQRLVRATIDIPFQLKVNQAAFIDSLNLRIGFVAVREDSRCPSDVVCIWEGQATINVDVQKANSAPSSFNLTYQGGRSNLSVRDFHDFSMRLLEIAPYPKSTERIGTGDYLATLVVTLPVAKGILSGG